jgi:fermentation-respiration switch protein FrsA (DUF1100 family)
VKLRMTKIAGTLLAIVAAGYISAAAYLYFFQRDYVFYPSGTLGTPAEYGLDRAEIVTFRTRDRTALTGWYAPAEPGQPTVLYFHGNAGNLADREDRFSQVIGSGFGLLAVSYRGFAGSGGSPSEAALVSDALELFDWLEEKADSVVVYVESLGTGIATQVAAERTARALVLEAPYTAALDIAAATYPWIPVSYLMRDPFLSREHIQRVDEPVLIVHGTADTVIPVEHGRRLFESAGEPKQIAIIEGARHNDLWERGLWPAVLGFLQTYPVAAQPEAAVRRMPSLAGR